MAAKGYWLSSNSPHFPQKTALRPALSRLFKICSSHPPAASSQCAQGTSTKINPQNHFPRIIQIGATGQCRPASRDLTEPCCHQEIRGNNSGVQIRESFRQIRFKCGKMFGKSAEIRVVPVAELLKSGHPQFPGGLACRNSGPVGMKSGLFMPTNAGPEIANRLAESVVFAGDVGHIAGEEIEGDILPGFEPLLQAGDLLLIGVFAPGTTRNIIVGYVLAPDAFRPNSAKTGFGVERAILCILEQDRPLFAGISLAARVFARIFGWCDSHSLHFSDFRMCSNKARFSYCERKWSSVNRISNAASASRTATANNSLSDFKRRCKAMSACR